MGIDVGSISLEFKGRTITLEQLPNGKFKRPDLSSFLIDSYGPLTWLDDCRIPYSSDNDFKENWREDKGSSTAFFGNADGKNIQTNQKGRFPANLCCEDNVFDDYSRYFSLDAWAANALSKTFPFLICPKASKSERNKGCEDLPLNDSWATRNKFTSDSRMKHEQNRIPNTNHHPTVKPLRLLSYLITLGSREGDLVLDPFVGSGTSYLAANQLNRKCIGIELNPEYLEIAKARVKPLLEQTKLV